MERSGSELTISTESVSLWELVVSPSFACTTAVHDSPLFVALEGSVA